jgi:hypothetical protein
VPLLGSIVIPGSHVKLTVGQRGTCSGSMVKSSQELHTKFLVAETFTEIGIDVPRSVARSSQQNLHEDHF